MELTLNTALAAEAGRDRTRAYVIMTGVIRDWEPSTPATALIEALESSGMPQIGEALSPTRTDLTCKNHYVKPLDGPGITYGNIARVRILFETSRLIGPTPIETFAVEDTTNLGSGTTQLLPYALTPLKVYGNAEDDDPENGPKDIATIGLPIPMRSIVLYGLFEERPSEDILSVTRHVNHAEWQGLPKGYWLCSGPRTRWSNLDEMYRVSVAFTTKQEEDWSEYQILRDPDTGRPWPVDDELVEGLKEDEYEFGINHQYDGILKVGPFRAANFTSIFGV